MPRDPGFGPDDHHVVVYMSSGTPKLGTVLSRNGSLVHLGRLGRDRRVDADRRHVQVGRHDRVHDRSALGFGCVLASALAL